MKQKMRHRFWVGALLGGLLLSLVSVQAEANRANNMEGWLDKLTGFVLIQKGTERQGNFDPYLDQISVMRSVFNKEWEQGDLRGTYAVMIRLMEMLQAREEGIRAEAAMAIWDYCYQVTPVALHDENRHPRALGFGSPEKKGRM